MNTETLQQIFPIFFICYILFVIVYLAKVSLLVRYIRSNHPKIWEELGGPSVIARNSPQSSVSVVSYLFSKKYLVSEDPKLIKKAKTTRALLLFGFVLLPFLFSGFFFME